MIPVLENIFCRKIRRAIGVRIGTSGIKLAVVSNMGKPVLEGLIFRSFTKIQPNISFLNDKKEITNCLISALQECRMVCKDAVIGLDGRDFFVREVQMPHMDVREMKEAVKWDVEKYVPYEPNTYYYDYAIVESVPDKMNCKVLLVATAKDTLDSLLEIVEVAGLRPLAIEVEPLALARVLGVEGNVMIVDLGGQMSQLFLFREGNPVLIRTISVGGNRFTETIMQECSLSFTEAEQMKFRYQHFINNQKHAAKHEVLNKEIHTAVSEIIYEIKRAEDYCHAQNPNMRIDKIYLTGGGANFDQLSQTLMSQLRPTVLLPRSTSNFELSATLNAPYVQNLFPQFASVIGLAMRGIQYDFH